MSEQATLWQSLQTRLIAGQLPHGLLLTGPKVSDKRGFADRLVQTLLCLAEPATGSACGFCHSCQLLASGNHPDRYALEPEQEGGSIKIDLVRAVQQDLNGTAQLGHGKVIVIDPAEGLNMAAANALLKALEEPPPQTYFLLLSTQPLLLAATIRSRCQVINFRGEGAVIEPDPLALEFSQDLKSLQQKTADPLALAQKWSKGNLQDLVSFLLASLSEQLRQEALQTSPTRLDLKQAYAFYDEVLATLNRLQHRANLNQQLVLEQLFLQYCDLK